MKLSILIPSIPQRLPQLIDTIARYESLIEKYGLQGQVELLSFCDNKQRSIGKKRSDLIAMSQGEYIVISDDDDKLTRKYFELIMGVIDQGPDVITYHQFARINNEYTFVDFKLQNPVGDFVHMGITQRPAWHCCTWKREVVKDIQFPHINYGEDHHWAMAANERAKKEIHISEICHVYEHDSDKTAAFL